MKIQYAIDYVNRTKRNTCDRKDMINWLSQLECRVKTQIIDAYEGSENVLFTGYDEHTDMGTELLVPAPYDEMYLRYLEAQIDYVNAEEERYNNAIDLFNRLWQEFRRYYIRTHMPKRQNIQY